MLVADRGYDADWIREFAISVNRWVCRRAGEALFSTGSAEFDDPTKTLVGLQRLQCNIRPCTACPELETLYFGEVCAGATNEATGADGRPAAAALLGRWLRAPQRAGKTFRIGWCAEADPATF